MNLLDRFNDIQSDADEVVAFSESLYDKNFGEFFHDQKELFNRLKDFNRPITDTELEGIMTVMPLELFTVSEALANFKLMEGVVKLKLKEKEQLSYQSATDVPESKKKEFVSYNLLEDKLLLSVYDSIIVRVEKEISFSRELIMTAKKIWDARRHTEVSNPISEVIENDSKLPEYTPERKYVK